MQQLKRPPVFREDGTIEIRLTQGYVAIIDAEDARLAQFNWCAGVDRWGKVYASRGVPKAEGGGRVLLHVEVAGPGDGICDHEDGDTMNCRRRNIRRVTPLENSRNRGVPANSTTGHLGVHRHKKRWRAEISNRRLGSFPTMEEAIQARLDAERELWGIQPVRRAEFE